MNEHDEIDTVRREFGALAGKVRDATATATRWNEARVQQAERARERSERARDRAIGRAERAMRLAERGQRYLHAQWRAADRAAADDLAVDLEAARTTRAEQEQLVAQWAWAQAHADENPAAAAELDARLLTETGIDPDTLRNPFAANTASERTQPFTPVEADAATATDEALHNESGTSTSAGDSDTAPAVDASENTVIDGEALIQGLIQAAHPHIEPNSAAAQQVPPATEVDEQLGPELSVPEADPGE